MNAVQRSAGIVGGLLIALAVAWWFPHVRNETFVLVGNRDEAGGYYGMWSGFGGALQVFTLVFGGMMIYWHHTCHAHPLCLRWGKYDAAGGLFKLCHRHHPDLGGKRPTLELIHRLHREHREPK